MQTPQGTGTASSSTTAVLPAFCAKYPPCRVCSGKASGLHYGVITCEACKGFFRRYSSKKVIVKCPALSTCDIIYGQRHCSACRLKKCFAVGMSKDFIKVGRSSYTQVTEAIKEVKSLELQLKMRRDGTLLRPEERLAEMDSICNRITQTHFSYFPHSAQFYEIIHEQEKIFLEINCLEEQLYGKRSFVKRSEYNEIYNQTKIDVDGRRSLFKSLLPLKQTSFNNFCKFTQSVPGFMELCDGDKKELVKKSYIDVTNMLRHGLYNVDAGIYVYPLDTSIVLTFESMFGYIDQPAQLCELMKAGITKTQQLELTHEETVIAAALSLLMADAELSKEGRRIVDANADNLAEALYHLLQKNHDQADHIYAKLILIAYDSKVVQDAILTFMKNVVEDVRDIGLPKDITDMYEDSNSICSSQPMCVISNTAPMDSRPAL